MERDLTQGTVAGHALRMAPPAVVSTLILTAFEIVDSYWVGRSEGAVSALAGLAVGTYVLWALYGVGHMVASGTLACVAQAVGAGDRDRARWMAREGLRLAGLAGLASLALLGPGVGLLLDITGIEGTTRAQSSSYLSVVLVGAFSLYGFAAVEAAFRGWGDTRTPMWLIGGALAANVLLDPLLIFGGFGIPALGLEGAAWATVITRSLGVAAGLFMLIRRGLLRRTRPPGTSFGLGRIVRIGLPPGISGVLYCVTFLGLVRLLGAEDEAAVSAFGVGQKAESFSWSAMVGLGCVASAFVGQNLGAGLRERARAGLLKLGLMGAGLSLISAALFLICPDALIEFFAPGQPEILEYGRVYLAIVAVSQVFLALEIILEMGITASGDSLPPMIIVVVLTLARVPIAMGLDAAFDLGVAAVFWAVTISTALKGVAMLLWYRRGTWVKRGAELSRETDASVASS